MWQLLMSGTAALAFAAIFIAGDRLHPLRKLGIDRRGAISFGAGIAVAYAFVHVIPELHDSRARFMANNPSGTLWMDGMMVYFVALLGFLVFYALDHMRAHIGSRGGTRGPKRAFNVHIVGFSGYVWLIGYQLQHYPGEDPARVALYSLAVGSHFWGLSHALGREHGILHDRLGRYLLASLCIAGWVTGLLVELPPAIYVMTAAFVSGAIIMNSMIMELPSEKGGRVVPFLAGGLLYGLILLPIAPRTAF